MLGAAFVLRAVGDMAKVGGGTLGWGFGILALWVINGLFTQAMLDAGDTMPSELQAVFSTEQLLDGYISFLGPFVGMLVTAYVVYAVQTLRTEEHFGHAAVVLATPVSRPGWLSAHVTVVAIGALLILVGTGIAAAAVTRNGALLGDVVASHLAAAILAVLGPAAGCFGVVPRVMTLVCWLVVAVIAIVDSFADLLDLPQWFRALSPLWHLPTVPVDDFALLPTAVLLGIAVVIAGIGLCGFRRREINVN
ncbi:hypothetical protein [Enteractinococcus helveticum]|uniref:ABC transporter permease n=1 Tax=Enteractinococcus helveticum TaxID=1837282 RepID=A0A1B7M1C0_9MICC|nr:hypothetical protein [Enteractinococcus helveticum]OAV62355.1 hypothetical protein A6F49_06475 [Enteractinococcus helveticum]